MWLICRALKKLILVISSQFFIALWSSRYLEFFISPVQKSCLWFIMYYFFFLFLTFVVWKLYTLLVNVLVQQTIEKLDSLKQNPFYHAHRFCGSKWTQSRVGMGCFFSSSGTSSGKTRRLGMNSYWVAAASYPPLESLIVLNILWMLFLGILDVLSPLNL